jgi:methionine-rich copper-binding protein CopC
MSSARSNFIAVVGVLALWLAVAPDAFAHAQLVKTEPARRATVAEAPKQVKLWFNEEIEGAYASLAVLDAAGKPVTDAKPEIAADDPKSLAIPLPALSPGTYTVKFRVLSVDGHVVDSTFDFTVK